jgi:cytosine/adenosine deaminase-related metal-dependent hydrolase
MVGARTGYRIRDRRLNAGRENLMRTAITATWIVGHHAGRHSLIRDGVVVYEGNKIVHVGKTFEGQEACPYCYPDAG